MTILDFTHSTSLNIDAPAFCLGVSTSGEEKKERVTCNSGMNDASSLSIMQTFKSLIQLHQD